jgi:hypothetical protein
MTERKLYTLALAFALSLVSFTQVNALSFRQGEQVELLKDEFLFFNSAISRRGLKGERFVIADHRPLEKRLFVFAKDPSNRVIALNFPDSSACPIVVEWSACAEKAFQALEEGRLIDAKSLLNELSKEPTLQPLCKRIQEGVQALEIKSVEYQLLQRKKIKLEADIVQRKKDVERLRNTPNDLIAGSNRNNIQALRAQREVEDLTQTLNATHSAAEQTVVHALEGLARVAEDLVVQGAHAEASGVLRALESVRNQMDISDKSFQRGISAFRLNFDKKTAESTRIALRTARSELAEKRLYAAAAVLVKALQKDPGSLLLNRAQEETRGRILSCEQRVREAEARKTARKHQEALGLLAEVRDQCVDCAQAESLEKELKTIEAERTVSLEKARNFEKEGAYDKALEIHTIYSDSSTIAGLFEKSAKQKEERGDFMGAAEAYEKANRKDLASAVKEKANIKISEYRQAEKMSVEGEYDLAAKIYEKYRDEEKLSQLNIKRNQQKNKEENIRK